MEKRYEYVFIRLFFILFYKIKIEDIYKNINIDNIKIKYTEMNIEDLFSESEKLSKAPQETPKRNMKCILFQCNSCPGTIQVSNISDGWFTLSYYITRSLQTTSYIFSVSEDSIKCAKNSMTYIKNNNIERVIYAMKDPKWVFYEEGRPLCFENLEFYKNKFIKKRLNKNIIKEYCSKLGLNIVSKEFWDVTGKRILCESIL